MKDNAPSPSRQCRAALAYAAQGWRVFPVRANKRPLTAHGLKDASLDGDAIIRWWARWPFADPARALGPDDVVIDVDGPAGYRDFERLDGRHPDCVETLQALTPNGRHLYYAAAPGRRYRNTVRILGAALDLRTAGGYVVLPAPGNGRRWLNGAPGAIPLSPAPAWLPESKHGLGVPGLDAPPAVPARQGDTPYGRAALRSACRRILAAECGEQESILNSQCLSIGNLIAGGELGERAIEALIGAAERMTAYRDPWRGLDRKVRVAVAAGRRRPRASG